MEPDFEFPRASQGQQPTPEEEDSHRVLILSVSIWCGAKGQHGAPLNRRPARTKRLCRARFTQVSRSASAYVDPGCVPETRNLLEPR